MEANNKTIEHVIEELVKTGICDSIGDIVTIQDSEHKIHYQNIVSKDLYGDRTGEYCYKAFAHRDYKCEGCALEASFKDGITHKFVKSEPSGDMIKYFEITASPLRDSKGKIIACIEVVRDVTEHKMTEKALIESGELYRNLFDNSPISLWEEDYSDVKKHINSLRNSGVKDFRAYFNNHPEDVVKCAAMIKVNNVNKATLALYKVESTEDFRDGLGRIFTKESFSVFKETLVCIAEGRTIFESEAINQSLEGDKIIIYLKWAIVPGYEETCSRLIVSVIDITERKKAENRLKEAKDSLEIKVKERTAELSTSVGLLQSEITERRKVQEEKEKLIAAIETTMEGVNITDNEGNIIYINDAYANIYLYKKEDLIGKHVSVIISPERRKALRERFKANQEKGHWKGEVIGTRSDGSKVPVLLTTTLIKNNSGSPIGTVGIIRDITELKKAEQTLRDSEARWRILFEQAPDGIILMDADKGELIDFNNKIIENLGYTREEFQKLKIYDFDVLESEERVANHIKKVMKKGFDTFETKHKTKGGKILDVMVNARAVTISGRNYIQSIWTDITERKQIEDTLHESEEKFRAIFNSSPDGILMVDTETKRFYLGNDMICRILGYSLKELKKLGIADIHPEEDIPYIIEQFTKLVNEEITRGSDIPVKRKDGSIFFADICGSNVQIQGRRYNMGIFRDVTERKCAEEALIQSEEKYRLLLTSINEIVYSLRFENEDIMKSRVEFVSDKALEITGYAPSEFLEQRDLWFQLIYPDDMPLVNASTASMVSDKRPNTRTYRLRKKGADQHIWLEDNVVPRLDKKGDVIGIFGVARDITERKLAEEERRKYSRELEESNTALRVLLKQRENDRSEIEEKVLENIKQLVQPYLTKLRTKKQDKELHYLDILESNLKEIISPFSVRLSSKYLDFTPKEIQIANLIKEGKQDKDIADIFNLAVTTVKFHRQNIRKKLGIYGKRTNLRTHLLTTIK